MNKSIRSVIQASCLVDVPEDVKKLIAKEQERCISVIRKYLLFDSQRAVSWHEIQDAIEAIRRGEQ